MKLIIIFLCISFLKQTESLLTTKTAYLDSFTFEQLEFMNITQNYQLEQCVPELVYLVLRHGSRYPSTKQIEKSNKFLDLVKQSNVNSYVLNDIKQTFYPHQHYQLSELGAFEMRNIAKRFQLRYPHLFNDLSKFDVISSSKDRSFHSAFHFLASLFENTNLEEKILINDSMMRLFDECDNYLNTVKRNDSFVHKEINRFINSSYVQNLLKNFKKRHQIENLEFEPKLLIKLFTLCNIESAHKMSQNWCKLFLDEEYEILSYLTDLKQYWVKSYGNELNSKMVFPIIQDLFKKIDAYLKNDNLEKRVFLRFGHAENIFPLVTALGLFNDEEGLNASNFEANLNRKFKSGLLSPFSSNIAFVLNKCNNNELKIMLFINELPLTKLNAGNLLCALKSNTTNESIESVCEFNSFKKQLNHYINIEYDQLCNLNIKTEL